MDASSGELLLKSLVHRRLARASALSLVVVVCGLGAVNARASGSVKPDTAGGLVISQVYAGGGNSGATYTDDFVELFNSGTTPQSVNGFSIQYAAAGTGNSGFMTTSNRTNLSNKTIAPGGYYLVALGSGGTAGIALPTADDTGSTNLATTGGKVALVNKTTPLTCIVAGTPDACVNDNADVVDFVGYGDSADFAGASPAPAGSATLADIRGGAGCTDAVDNSTDFATGTPSPRSSATTAMVCGGGPGPEAGPEAGSEAGADAGSDASSDGGPTTGVGTGLVLSQVFGAGGNTGAMLNSDFVELFNRSSSSISLSGLSIQYGSAAGDFASLVDGGDPNLVNLPASASIPPGGYFLVAMGTPGDAGANLPTADFTGTANLSGTNGKVALARVTSSLACGGTSDPCAGTEIVDLVGYGTADEFEGSGAVPALTSTTAALRNGAGCTDTNDNKNDFTAATPAPRTSTTPANECSGGGGGGSDASTTNDASPGDDDDDDGGTTSLPGVDSGTNNIELISDPNDGGCSTVGRMSGAWREEAVSFAGFVGALALFIRRRRRSKR